MRGCAEGMRATLTGGTRVVSGPCAERIESSRVRRVTLCFRSVRRENRVESSTAKGDTLFPVRAPRESSRVEYCEG